MGRLRHAHYYGDIGTSPHGDPRWRHRSLQRQRRTSPLLRIRKCHRVGACMRRQDSVVPPRRIPRSRAGKCRWLGEHAGYASGTVPAGTTQGPSPCSSSPAAFYARVVARRGESARHLTDEGWRQAQLSSSADPVSQVYKLPDTGSGGPVAPGLASQQRGTTEENLYRPPREDSMHFVRSRQAGTVYADAPADVTASRLVWDDLVAYGLTNSTNTA